MILRIEPPILIDFNLLVRALGLIKSKAAVKLRGLSIQHIRQHKLADHEIAWPMR